MKKKIIIAFVVVIALVLGFTFFGSSGKDKAAPQFVKVEQGKFEILVIVTGELKAQNSEDIMAPTELRGRTFRISEVKIQDLIPEGTVVDSGEYVATLDRSALSNQLKTTEDDLEKSLQSYLKAQLDTTLQLRELRNNLINLKFDMEEKHIVLEQSKYEPPATQRQAQINLDKAEREFKQASHNYNLKKDQAEASMKEVGINLERQRRERQDMLDVLDKFVIRAPKQGMVIYYREWSGSKRKVGSNVSPWDLTVATLPDLSVMNSKTYVNEIDISKVKKNQSVRVTVDAFPEKKFTGEVVDVANIGEQLPNTDAKVFEVVIRVNEYDPILRPSMTTGNQIITNVYDSVMYIPLEALHANDSISYVFTRKGKRQVVVPGEMNENYIIVEQGLGIDDEIYLSMPEKPEKFELVGQELIPVLKEKVQKKKLEAQRLQQEQEQALKSKADFQKMMMQGNLPAGVTVKKSATEQK
ncbi:MAG: efflux RND transporter periplasmic adaptor subunit [Bacteroidales bacterium]|nr:efflux RND transporter periplasmic adaptor subunit [Bacteroidales bacterium]